MGRRASEHGQLFNSHHQLERVHCTLIREFMSGLGVPCWEVVFLHYKSNLGLVFCKLFQHSHLNLHWFTKVLCRLLYCIRQPNFCLISEDGDSPSSFANAIFCWFTKVLCHQCFMLYSIMKYTVSWMLPNINCDT